VTVVPEKAVASVTPARHPKATVAPTRPVGQIRSGVPVRIGAATASAIRRFDAIGAQTSSALVDE